MEDTQKEFLADYERRLREMLVGNLSSTGKLDGQLLTVEELNEKWHAAAPSYMADAVPQIARYPLAAVAWAMYVGMGAAVLWDKDWNRYSQTEDWYAMLSSPRGFDALDEYVTEVLLAMPLDSDRARTVEECVRSTAESALAMIRKGAHRGAERNGIPHIRPHGQGHVRSRCSRGAAPHRIQIRQGKNRNRPVAAELTTYR